MTLTRAEALDTHTQLAIVTGDHWVQGYVQQIAKWSLGMDEPGATALYLHWDVLQSPTYRFRASAMPELRERIAAMDNETTFEEVGLPRTDKGVLIFEEPFRYVLDLDAPERREVLVHILTWAKVDNVTDRHGEVGDAYLFTVWNDANRAPSTEIETMDKDTPWFKKTSVACRNLWLGQFSLAAPASRVGPEYASLTPDAAERLRMLKQIRKQQADRISLYNIGRMIYAAFAIMNEPLPESDDEPIERHARRRASKAGMSSSRVDDITVVNVRHHSGPRKPVQNPGTGHKLDHRVTVPEHYRNQAYGPGRKLRKRILIAEHQRGPEGTPVINRPRVHDVRG